MVRLRCRIVRLRLLIHLGLSLCVVLAPVLSLVVPRTCCAADGQGIAAACRSCSADRSSQASGNRACCGAKPVSQMPMQACCCGATPAVTADRDSATGELARQRHATTESIWMATLTPPSPSDALGFGCRIATCRCGGPLLAALELPKTGRSAAEQLVTMLEWGMSPLRHTLGGTRLVSACNWPPGSMLQARPPIYSSGAAAALICCWLC
jgi:hypothetical protein